uniref:Phage holin family protein n=1 Tax=Solibacter usitatus (strain Ellin6076) TaxID=234267 RepID=Q01ZE9_SOLUE
MAYQGERSFSEVFESIVGNVQTMIRSEIQLAKAEVKEEAAKSGRATGILTAGALLGLYAVGFLLLTVARALEYLTPAWLASLIVAVLAGLAGLIAINAGRARLKHVHTTPDKTIQSVRENVAWVKDQTKS